jgi:DDE superfamily endonuclease
MVTLPKEFSRQISAFSPLFSKKVFEHVKVLFLGSLLTVGRRTVCGVLRVVGLSGEERFHKYHRVLSRAKWSCLGGAQILLGLLVDTFSDKSEPIIVGIDETIERRWGAKIKARGIYRDAVNSSQSHFAKASGLRWMCLMLLSPIPWAKKIWGLPFFLALAPSERYYEQSKRRHKKLTDWARQMLLQLHRWLPGRRIIIVADGAYTCYELLEALQQKVSLISPLRLDARLFNKPRENPAGKRGPKPKYGTRQITLKKRLEDGRVRWDEIIIPNWYGQENKKMLITTGKSIWYKSSFPTIELQWVLLKDPEGKIEPKAIQCTDLNLSPIEMINYFIRRWTLEVTFQEVRTHLGVETQRQWSDKAIARTTPLLMGLFSLTTLLANQLNEKEKLTLNQSAWYHKELPTFSDAITSVRYQIWLKQKLFTSLFKDDVNNLKASLFKQLILNATRAA